MNWTHWENSGIVIVFCSTFLLLAVWESRQPARRLHRATERRWLSHGALLLAAAIAQTLVLRTTPVLTALAVRDASWGVLNRPQMPWILQAAVTIVILDLVHYVTHRLFHSFPVLWRVHELHHSDLDYDVSVAARFHPVEVVAAKAAQVGAIGLLCPPPESVLGSELLSTLLNLLTHANVTLPATVERVCGRILITPDIHRVHHSAHPGDMNCNFGQSFVWWDRLFKTYRGRSGAPIDTFETGVRNLPEEFHGTVLAMLSAPFRRRR